MRTHARIRSRRTSHYPIVGLALAGAILNGMTYPIRADATQQAVSSPAFEVASVKPNRSGTTQANAGLQPNGVNLINLPLRGSFRLPMAYRSPRSSSAFQIGPSLSASISSAERRAPHQVTRYD